MMGFFRWLAGSWLEPDPPGRLKPAEVLEIARRHVFPRELVDAGASPFREKGKTIWRVVTNVGMRGGHIQVYVDDESGKVVREHTVPY